MTLKQERLEKAVISFNKEWKGKYQAVYTHSSFFDSDVTPFDDDWQVAIFEGDGDALSSIRGDVNFLVQSLNESHKRLEW